MHVPVNSVVLYRFFNRPQQRHYGDVHRGRIVDHVSISPVRDYIVESTLADGRKHYTSIWSHEILSVEKEDNDVRHDV